MCACVRERESVCACVRERESVCDVLRERERDGLSVHACMYKKDMHVASYL